MLVFRAAALAFTLAVALVACMTCASADTFARRPSATAAAGGPIRVSMRDVTLYPYRDAPARVFALTGTIAPTRAGRMVVLDDVTSYGVVVQYAHVALTAAALTVLMNRHILPASHDVIKQVDVTFGTGTIALSGIVAKGKLRAHFKATAIAQPTSDGDMRLHVVKMIAGGFLPKGLLDALGLKLSKVVQPRNRHVFHVVGDDLIVPVVSMFPAPVVSGRLRSVSVTPRALLAVIGASEAPPLPAYGPSFIHYRGGELQFAKLTMQGVNLTVVSKTRAPLEFSPANYYRQMEAGFVVPQPDGGLIAHVPNYGSLR